MNAQEVSIQLEWGCLRGKGYNWSNPRKILALHGWLDNCATFDLLMRSLDKIDAAVFALDFSGHGKSDHRKGVSNYHFPDWLCDIEDTLNYLQWESCSIMAHSIGAAAGSIYAALEPSKIEELIFIDGLGQIPAKESDCFARFQKFFQQRQSLLQRPQKIYSTLEEIVQKRIEVTPMNLIGARAIIERNFGSVNSGFQMRADPVLNLRSPLAFTQGQMISILQNIQCPTNILRANPGYIFPADSWEQLVSAVPQCTQEIVPGSHYVHIDSPELIATKILKIWEIHKLRRPLPSNIAKAN